MHIYIYILLNPYMPSMTYICFDLSHIVDYFEEIDERMESGYVNGWMD